MMGNQPLLPSLDNLSAGQASLFAMFGTIIRYGDFGNVLAGPTEIKGIVLIDEIDAHLHADLQHDVLPNLIRLFPGIQFIVTSHAPLFPLGMRKAFGDDGFSLIEMPPGVTIDAERFSEFEVSLAYFQATRTFETAIQTKLLAGEKPLVLCEGETDPKYLRAAAEILGFSDLAAQVDFDCVGVRTAQGSHGAGKSHLNDAHRFLKNNPQFQIRRVVLLYDSDTNKMPENTDKLFVRSLPCSTDAVRKRGIENLLPNDVFDTRFFRDKNIKSGDDDGTVRELDKVALCEYLCNQVRNPSHFEGFRAPLAELRSLLLPAQAPVQQSVNDDSD
jgi:hypothetical protein